MPKKGRVTKILLEWSDDGTLKCNGTRVEEVWPKKRIIGPLEMTYNPYGVIKCKYAPGKNPRYKIYVMNPKMKYNKTRRILTGNQYEIMYVSKQSREMSK